MRWRATLIFDDETRVIEGDFESDTSPKREPIRFIDLMKIPHVGKTVALEVAEFLIGRGIHVHLPPPVTKDTP